MIVVGRREEEKMFRCGPEKVGGGGLDAGYLPNAMWGTHKHSITHYRGATSQSFCDIFKLLTRLGLLIHRR